MSKLFEKFVYVAIRKNSPLNVAKLTGSRLLYNSITGSVDSAFKPNKLLFDEAKMIAPLEEFWRYRIRYIFFNEKRQRKSWESDLGINNISTEISKGIKEIFEITG
uniref:AAA_14 domain-containing protein n=1 Tax=Meloidogyne hapla TaxID=6305 RepID=A0A1I8BLD6_MELHA